MDSSATPSQQQSPQMPSSEVYPQEPVQHAPQQQSSNSQPPQQPSDPTSTDYASSGPLPGQDTSPQSTQEQYDPAQAATIPNESAIIPGMAKPMPEEILFEWQALSRPYKARNRQYFTTIGLIAALVALILLFAGQMFSVAVIAAVIFVIYVLNTTPPGMVTHKLTTYGIRVENNLYYWEEMGSFWFTEKYGENILNIEISRFPNRLTLLLGSVSKDDMQLVLSEVLLNQQPPPTAYEKAAAWLQEKLPIDIES